MDPAGADMESGEGGRGTWWVWRVLGGCLLAVVLSVVGLIAFREFVLYSPTNVNEVHTISDLRVVISAQAAWQSANGGHFEGELSCLASPASCLPGFPPDGPTFLDPTIASLGPRYGYLRAFAGGRRPRTIDPKVSSRSSVENLDLHRPARRAGPDGLPQLLRRRDRRDPRHERGPRGERQRPAARVTVAGEVE
jgi:hypothetical protein